MNVLKVVDVVDVGIEKERVRQRFYAEAAEQFDHPALQTLFHQLSAWEGQHVLQFQAIRNRLIAHQPQEQYPGEMIEYISVLLDQHLRKIGDAPDLKQAHSPVDAIDIGIGFEKEAILLFMELLPYIQEEDKKIIRLLIEEERQHVVKLNTLRQQLN